MSPVVVLAIQARSTSVRLPGKAHALIGGERMLDRVLAVAKRASAIINRPPIACKAKIVIACPRGDKIATDFAETCAVVEGPEHDVLERFRMVVDTYKPDLVARITGDCPLLPPHLVSAHVDLALRHQYDYVSNVDERWRTTIDGTDIEVMTPKILLWAAETATRPADREHVTTFIRHHPPDWAKIGTTLTSFDMSHVKLSVDTPEDLQRVVDAYNRAHEKYELAVRTLKLSNTHRLYG